VGILAIPNVSEGRDSSRIEMLTDAVRRRAARVLDVHTDAVHHRSVFTLHAPEGDLIDSLADLAVACRAIDLREHSGVHPRLGVLDVCPVVADPIPMEHAAAVARSLGRSIAARAGLPVYLYGAAARRDATRDLPELRRRGLNGLVSRARAGLLPDFGPPSIDMRHGVVCVGARGVLVAFNVWLRCDLATAKSVAAAVRTSGGGPPAVRAIGLPMGAPDCCQVSMNLLDPETTGVDDAFAVVAREAEARGAALEKTELVGLVPERFQPDPTKPAARLLARPGRSLESVLQS